ncbi:MAG: tetratricopeptide repeat protein [Bdellovibrio sp.]
MTPQKLLILFLLFTLNSSWTQAQVPSSAELFKKGTEAYLTKNYQQAQEQLTQALGQDPDNSLILTNLALSYFQLGKKPLAIAYFRKALTIDPELLEASAGLKFALSQTQIREVPRQIESYESFRNLFLQPVPLYVYLILSALTLFCSGWLLISYVGRRKRLLSEEKAPPPFPVIASLLSALFVVFTGLAFIKFYDAQSLRGTIIQESVAVQTAPGDNQVTILELYGGMEVLVRKVEGEWVQVTYPGSLTGWIKTSALLMTR